MENSFRPNWTSPPGNTVWDILSIRNIQLHVFADNMNMSLKDVNDLLDGNAEIDFSVAKKLSEICGGSDTFWLERESKYRKRLDDLNFIDTETWLAQLPIADMKKFGWIKSSGNIFEECLNYFDVPDLTTWRKIYIDKLRSSAFRTSTSLNSNFGSVAAWLRQGELLADDIPCDNWNLNLFVSKIESIRALTRQKSPKVFLPKLKEICSKCGIAVVITPTPAGCRASGVTKFVSDNKAIIQLSFRYRSDDHFWFTFFHEAGHLVLHNEHRIFIEKVDDLGAAKDEKELEANLFAQHALIPHELENELINLRRNKKEIVKFAMRAGISPGVVIGQLQHRGIVRFEYLNGYKRRYDWNDILEN